MEKLFRSIAITLFIPILIVPSSALAQNKAVKIEFFCAPSQDDQMIPTTNAKVTGTKEYLPLIIWKYRPPQGMTNQQRCKYVSERFQSAWERNKFDRLIAGKDRESSFGFICAVAYRENNCNESNALFMLSEGSDAKDILDRLRRVISSSKKGISPPIHQAGDIDSVDMQLLINKLIKW
jgi:hypothetical protein